MQANQPGGEVLQRSAEEEEGEEIQVDGVRIVLNSSLERHRLHWLFAVEEQGEILFGRCQAGRVPVEYGEAAVGGDEDVVAGQIRVAHDVPAGQPFGRLLEGSQPVELVEELGPVSQGGPVVEVEKELIGHRHREAFAIGECVARSRRTRGSRPTASPAPRPPGQSLTKYCSLPVRST